MPLPAKSSLDPLKEFERYLRSQDRAEKTITDYLTDLHLFAEWFKETNDEPFKPKSLTPTDVRDYRAYLLNVKRQSPATINRRLVTLRVFCRWALNAELIASNPTNAIKPVKQVQQAPRWLDRKEQYALRRASEKDGDPRNLAIILLLTNTGLRVSEVAGLKLSDIEMSDRKGQVTVHGKGTKVRTIPLNAEIRKALRDFLAKRPKVHHHALYLNKKGEALGRLARLERVTPHMLRHTIAKNLVDQSVSLDQVVMLMGHRSLTTTARYTQPSQQDLARAVEKLTNE
ncbi:MAG: tyrosine-type recombinase/integrase [Chloroflexi bacterium]|nr:tyrosine-type recombinase/integrase [Chloroflexota bacterium]